MEHFLLQLYTTLLEFSLPVKTISFSFFLTILPDRSLQHCFHIDFNWITVEKKKKQPYPYIELHMVHTPVLTMEYTEQVIKDIPRVTFLVLENTHLTPTSMPIKQFH